MPGYEPVVHGFSNKRRNPRETTAMDFTGYRQAVVHLAWVQNVETGHLLFGMVELRPSELPDAVGCATKSSHAEPKRCESLHYRRFVLSAADALEWYEHAASSTLSFPREPGQPAREDGTKLVGGPFVQEPPWPHLVTSNELIFAPDWLHGSRTHFLFPEKAFRGWIAETVRLPANREALERWLNFDVVDAYPDYQGVLCLIAPNPVFRSVERTHVEDATAGSAETVAYKLIARQGQRLDGLRLEVVDERSRGRMEPLVHEFGGDAIAVLEFPAEVNREGQSITHPEHGLLDWHEPLPLLRTIHTRMGLVTRRKTVQVPAAGRKRPTYEYEVDEVGGEEESVVGDAVDAAAVVSRLTDAESRRALQRAAHDYDQRWFDRTPHEAAHYLRQRIGRARETVLIVDPYFAGRELLAFGHAIRRPDVELRILTSAQGLKKDNLGQSSVDSGRELLRIVNETFDDYPRRPQIRVMTRNPPPVHDRFLVVDGVAWFSGNSLNTLGQRAGMIVKLPDPVPVVVRLEAFWRQASSLSDWLCKQPAASATT